jgi:hypothetical protein
MTKISAEKGGELSIFTELPRRAILGDSEGQRVRRREGRSLKRENGLGPPQARRERWVACGPSFYLSLGLPSAKQWQTAPRTALFIAAKLPLFTEVPRRSILGKWVSGIPR